MTGAPTWAYDALRICTALEHPSGGATAAEIQIFAYLACLISIYDGRAAHDWGYTFTATPAGAPYARDLAATTDRVRAQGLILDRPLPPRCLASTPPRPTPSARTSSAKTPSARIPPIAPAGEQSRDPDLREASAERWTVPTVLGLSAQGERELTFLSTFSACTAREPYLEAATSAVRLMPLPSVSNAVTYEPGLRRALERPLITELLDEPSMLALRKQFEALATALHTRSSKAHDLLVPTAIWLRYLSESADTERLAA